jgi:hypothetical protein
MQKQCAHSRLHCLECWVRGKERHNRLKGWVLRCELFSSSSCLPEPYTLALLMHKLVDPPPPAFRLPLMRTQQAAQTQTQRQRHRRTDSFADTPLYPGYGTYFSYVWVGSPPQRVSAITDTGSHYTAFPCTGCDNCGKHTDPHFDVSQE